MTVFRWFFGLPLAAVVTAGLFAMMAGLIRQKEVGYASPDPNPEIKILAEIEPLNPRRRPPKPDKIPENPPEPIIPQTLPGEKPQPPLVAPKKGPVDIDTGVPSTGHAVIKIKPLYPENCRSRGAEGDVLVQFDVTREGNVVNIRIVESADRCFDRTVRNTVAKWKYSPAYVNGRPVARYAVVERFHFQLER